MRGRGRLLAALWIGLAAATAAVAADESATSRLLADRGVRQSIALFETWLEAERAYNALPGVSAAFVADQDVIWRRGFGLAHPEHSAAASVDTLYSICSISKLFTSIGIMQLRDTDRLELDAPIQSILPWYDLKQRHPGSAEVTLRGVTSATGESALDSVRG